MKVFVDNVAAQAVETCLLAKLGEILSPTSILEMNTDLITAIAAQPEETQIEREQLSRKLAVLKSGLDICKRYASRPARKTIDKGSSTTGVKVSEPLLSPTPIPQPMANGTSPWGFNPTPAPAPTPPVSTGPARSSLFQPPQTPATSSSLFASTGTAERPTSSGSANIPSGTGLFGSTPAATDQPARSVFGQAPPAASSGGFGGPFASLAAAAASTGFGSGATSGAPATSTGFGGSPSIFGQPSQGAVSGGKNAQIKK